MDLNGKKIVVIGMGKTGIASAEFLGKHGAKVVATDEKGPDQWGPALTGLAREKWFSSGNYTVDILTGADLVVPSPGVPPHQEILVSALKKGIPVISEIELAFRFLKVPLVAVTGTNGKTTTTSLLGEILRNAGKKVFVGGNIGNPLIEYASQQQQDDYVVAEISSFQLQWIETFRPFVAMLLNITCDHINYHGSFAEYRRVKGRIFENQTGSDYAILNAEDTAYQEMAGRIRAQVTPFSSRQSLSCGTSIKRDYLIFCNAAGGEERYPMSMINLPGLLNVENVMAAVMAARFCGCSPESIIQSVSQFRGLAHRIEFAGVVKSIKFYDDSKGTNVDSVLRALETFSAPVILLLGGRDKDGDFETLKPLLAARVKRLILFGEARDRIGSLIGSEVPTQKEKTLKSAVENAYHQAHAGDVVLLSPGCASFDEFANYKERCNFFQDVVRNL